VGIGWEDHYYDILEFYFAEPQHLNRLKYGPEKTYKFPKVKKRLQRLEVPLNHIMAQFFLLAPDAFCRALFTEMFDRRFEHEFVLYGRDVDTEFRLENSVQPDFTFLSDDDVVCMEMKLDARCSVDQILKYALLGLAVELREKKTKTHRLAVLGRGPFCKWDGGFKSLDAVKEAVQHADLTTFLRGKPADFRDRQEQFNLIVEQIQEHLQFWTYGSLAHFLTRNMPNPDDYSPGADVYRKLLCGMIKEFKKRGLCDSNIEESVKPLASC
jgi:hypothetical protein